MFIALKKHVAIVTGGSRGIGRAVALALARAGAAVVLVARDAGALDSLADEIGDGGGKAFPLSADLADDAQLASIVPRAVEAFGKVSILVNNAGIGIYGPIERATADEWDLLMRVNARAPLLLARDAIAPMRAGGGGAIMNIASVVGIKGYVNQGIYTATKHAMMGWSKVLAQEVARDGIRVHTICPGGVATDMAAAARPDLDPGGLIRPEEIAETVLFLLAMRGNAVIDDVHIRRAGGDPWF